MEKESKESKFEKKEDDSYTPLYDLLKKKYALPEFELVQREFDINEFETDFVLKEIREKMKDKFDYASKIIETLFQPEGDFSSFIETKHFENDMKDEYFSTYKRLRYLVREAQLLSIKNADTLDAEYIVRSAKEWNDLKKVLIVLLEKFKSCWTDKGTQDDVKYFG